MRVECPWHNSYGVIDGHAFIAETTKPLGNSLRSEIRSVATAGILPKRGKADGWLDETMMDHWTVIAHMTRQSIVPRPSLQDRTQDDAVLSTLVLKLDLKFLMRQKEKKGQEQDAKTGFGGSDWLQSDLVLSLFFGSIKSLCLHLC